MLILNHSKFTRFTRHRNFSLLVQQVSSTIHTYIHRVLAQRTYVVECMFYYLQAENEVALARLMLETRAWEPLVNEAPPNQWKWPM